MSEATQRRVEWELAFEIPIRKMPQSPSFSLIGTQKSLLEFKVHSSLCLHFFFLAVLGLCCVQAFSSCSELGYSSFCARASQGGGFSCCRAQALQVRLSSCGSQALLVPRLVKSSQTRDRTRVPYTGRQILSHCTTKKVLYFVILILLLVKKDRN